MWGLLLVTFTVALLSGMGVGSAGLLVTYLVLVIGTPQLEAQGLNLLFFLFSSGAALLLHAFRTPPIWGLLLFLVPTGLLGAWGGTALALFLPQALLRRLFGWLLVVSGTLGLFRRKK